jgi:predicted metal-dependent hydrolase
MQGITYYSKHELRYHIRLSARRTMAITVHPNGAIDVVAPNGSSPGQIEARVRKRARWIVRQRLYFEQFCPRSQARRYIGGETHLFLGRQYQLKLVPGDRKEVKLKGGFLTVTFDDRTDTPAIQELVTKWYREKAEALFVRRFEAIAPRFACLG